MLVNNRRFKLGHVTVKELLTYHNSSNSVLPADTECNIIRRFVTKLQTQHLNRFVRSSGDLNQTSFSFVVFFSFVFAFSVHTVSF